MTFFSIVTRGLLRRPVRTGLTLIGISIGIAAVVALVGMSRGFEQSWTTGLKVRGTDIVVNNVGSTITPKEFNASVREKIAQAKLPRIAAIDTLLVQLLSIETSDLMILSAREWGGFSWENLKLLSGRVPKDGTELAVLLGQTAAQVLKKKVGDPIQIENKELTVVGIVDGGAVVENGSVILSLPLLQEITDNKGKINVIDIRVTPGTTEAEIQELCKEIERVAPEVHALPSGQQLQSSEGLRLVRGMSWGTSMLAIIVGVLGVMNTMLMTVFERTQEFCILLALGWRNSRIARLVLMESALLGFMGGVVGVTLGVIGVKILQQSKAIRGLLEPDLGIGLLLTSVAISIVVGVLSGLYPAWRSSRLSPGRTLHG
jgi:putative ABC transport system permease protein